MDGPCPPKCTAMESPLLSPLQCGACELSQHENREMLAIASEEKVCVYPGMNFHVRDQLLFSALQLHNFFAEDEMVEMAMQMETNIRLPNDSTPDPHDRLPLRFSSLIVPCPTWGA